MLEYLSYPFIQRALLGGVVIALCCGAIGPPLVLRRLSLLGDGLAHTAFAGTAIGILLGIPPLYAIIVVTLLGSYVVTRMLHHGVNGDAAIALLLALGVGGGILVISSTDGFTANLNSYLFGSILTISAADIIIAAVLLGAIILYYCLFTPHILMLCFNQKLASLTLRHSVLAESAYAALVALTIAITIRAVGILLVSAMLTIPTLIALPFARSFRRTVIAAAVISAAVLILGLGAAVRADTPPGATIVVLLVVVFAAGRLFLARRKRRSHPRASGH